MSELRGYDSWKTTEPEPEPSSRPGVLRCDGCREVVTAPRKFIVTNGYCTRCYLEIQAAEVRRTA